MYSCRAGLPTPTREKYSPLPCPTPDTTGPCIAAAEAANTADSLAGRRSERVTPSAAIAARADTAAARASSRRSLDSTRDR
uniref:Uncharacterized protein n=1 Tax=Arundo donax TaxID=35708 RepID=A0A0A9CQR1_ARUDO